MKAGAAILLIIAALVIIPAFVLITMQQGREIPLEALAGRVSASRPQWDSYQEDIKGQIGAGPVAEWAGAPSGVSQEGGALRISFRVEAPWSAYDFAIPILVRAPSGEIYRDYELERKDGRTTYVFETGGGRIGPWIVVRYPHHEQRIALNAEGAWLGE